MGPALTPAFLRAGRPHRQTHTPSTPAPSLGTKTTVSRAGVLSNSRQKTPEEGDNSRFNTPFFLCVCHS